MNYGPMLHDVVDLDALTDVLQINESVLPENFYMGWWMRRTLCGTVACLVGNFCLARPHDTLRLVENPKEGTIVLVGEDGMVASTSADNAVSRRFGLSGWLTDFLFTAYRPGSKNQAISRLKKTIAYFRRKRELWAEHEWLMGLSRQDRLRAVAYSHIRHSVAVGSSGDF